MINFIYIWSMCPAVQSTSFFKNTECLANQLFAAILNKSCQGLHIYMLKILSTGESSSPFFFFFFFFEQQPVLHFQLCEALFLDDIVLVWGPIVSHFKH